MDRFRIVYNFQLDFKTSSFELNFDENLSFVFNEKQSYPEWCRIDNNKCPNCPLLSSEHTYCPTAMALVEIFNFSANTQSFDIVNVVVDTNARKYQQIVTMQKAISSIIGLIMASSECPILAKLKPMVKHHLPFATAEETVSRVISCYLLAQYYKKSEGGEPDWELNGLIEIYRQVHLVNQNFFLRLKKHFPEDTELNAISILESFVNTMSLSIDGIMKNSIKELLMKSF